jgi:hypothetical protein
MIRVDTSEAETFLDGLYKDQIPFAASLALNQTAKDAQRAIQTHVAGTFILRRAQFVLQETAKIPRFSNKNDPELAVEILATDRADFMRKFEEGIAKESIRGVSLAIPIGARLSRDEIIPKGIRPRALQLRAHRTASGKVQLKGKFRTFAIKGLGIFQRIGPALADIKLLYLFKKRVKTPAVLIFKQTAEKVIAAKWAENFAAAFARAIRSAK